MLERCIVQVKISEIRSLIYSLKKRLFLSYLKHLNFVMCKFCKRVLAAAMREKYILISKSLFSSTDFGRSKLIHVCAIC